jgi:tyrosyl-tRNA synthetase
MNFIEELKWRGMIQDLTPGTEEQTNKELTVGYVGIDPTADSLHIGHLVGVMILKHFQNCGHKPLALVGGATGMIGDPSGKSSERNLLDEKTLCHNQECIKNQLRNFLDFDSGKANSAEMVNNYDWMKNYTFLDFIRDIGKHITVNYMMAKDSVKKRFSGEMEGMSFTEFTYQLVQGYDYLWLYQNKNCKLQMGGSDQWGNITTGTELIRRKTGGEAFALVCPLITKADGGKFGKTESGNVWLDAEKTSPYQFYQFWLNCSDADSEKYIKIFTMFSRDEVANMIVEHAQAPHLRTLQKTLAKDMTIRVHGEKAFEKAGNATEILFGKATKEMLSNLDEQTFLEVFSGVEQFEISRDEFGDSSTSLGMTVVDFLAEKTQIYASKGEARRALKENGVSINKEKVNEQTVVSPEFCLNDKYILVQKGKKQNFLVVVK